MKTAVIVQKKKKAPATMAENASSAPSQSSDSNILSALSSMAVKPVQDILEREIEKYSKQAREKIAKERSVPTNKVPDLDVAEYLLGMPTANLAKPMADMAVTLRNSLLIMTVAICTTIFLTRRLSK